MKEDNTENNEEKITTTLNQLYPLITPECLDSSRVCSLLSEQFTFKISDLLSLKEISKYISNKEFLLKCLKRCDFVKISNNCETATYTIPETFTVFSILNFPAKMSKTEVEKSIDLVNLSYSRLYKKSLYWILATNDKETVICSQNSLRELVIEDTKIKYDIKNKSQILKLIKDQIDKNSYQKEAKNLGVGNKKSDKKYEDKASNNESEAFSWRKGSAEGKSSSDGNE